MLVPVPFSQRHNRLDERHVAEARAHRPSMDMASMMYVIIVLRLDDLCHLIVLKDVTNSSYNGIHRSCG